MVSVPPPQLKLSVPSPIQSVISTATKKHIVSIYTSQVVVTLISLKIIIAISSSYGVIPAAPLNSIIAILSVYIISKQRAFNYIWFISSA